MVKSILGRPPHCGLGVFIGAAFAFQWVLLTWSGWRSSPTADEVAHLSAGIFIWQHERFDLYTVNPPLVRLVASGPVVLAQPKTDWGPLFDHAPEFSFAARPEWSIGLGFLRLNLDRWQRLFAMSRWACLPFWIIGGYVCWRWAAELYGARSGAVAAALWCFSPNVLAWSATICPDAPAAAMGAAAGYVFWRWLKRPDWFNTLGCGILLGLVQLTKTTWIILFALWPAIWGLWCAGAAITPGQPSRGRQTMLLAVVLGTAFYLINLGYAYEGTLTKLGEYTFVSRTLSGKPTAARTGLGGNRFQGGWLEGVPIPLPRDYLRGIDLQKTDFERGLPSYLMGEWRDRGWWYFYAVCAAIKVPLGTWLLGLVALGVRIHGLAAVTFRPRLSDNNTRSASPAPNWIGWRDELVLLLPAVILVAFVSSQTGFSHHFRYVLPAFPFLFIWVSSVAERAACGPKVLRGIVIGALVWSATSSLWVYPHSMSYFNEIIGGPREGHRYVLESNIDWGQDITYLRRWLRDHPNAAPLRTLFRNSFSHDLLGIQDREEPPRALVMNRSRDASPPTDAREPGPLPGWYAVSVQRIYDRDGAYQYFLRFSPEAMAGYSICIYHITREEANRVRGEMGLPKLPTVDNPTAAAATRQSCSELVRARS